MPSDLNRRGPVPLAGYFAETALDHVELPGLTCGSVAEYLQREGIPADDLGNPNDVLAGFVLTAGRAGWAFVSAGDLLPRRRFTAAYELGHFLLHRATMGRFRADTDATLHEAEDDVTDQMEREANRFAVELLMPFSSFVMAEHSVVGVYKTLGEAEAAVQSLGDGGFPEGVDHRDKSGGRPTRPRVHHGVRHSASV